MASPDSSIMTAVFNKITTDPTLETLSGGTVRSYYIMADRNARFPYIVSSLSYSSAGEENHPMRAGLLTMDVWDDSASRSTCLDMARRLEVLLSRKEITTDDYLKVRLWFQSVAWIPTDRETVHRREVTFYIRFYDQGVV